MYLLRQGSGGANQIDTILVSSPGANVYPTNIGEICTLQPTDQFGVPDDNDNGGVVYFTADVPGVGNGVLCSIGVADTGVLATVVLNSQNHPIFGAHHLHALSDNGTPGFYRLYFSAPVTSTVNQDYFPQTGLPVGLTDLGTKPWVLGL